MKTNKEIIIEELNKVDSAEYYHKWVLHDKKIFEKFATNLLSKQQKLDRKEVEEIFKDMLIMIMSNFCDENGNPEDMAIDIWEDNKNDFDILIDQICQLCPKNQMVILEGVVDEDGWIEDIQVGKEYINKPVKIILEEESEK